jgi:hypothetical protein
VWTEAMTERFLRRSPPRREGRYDTGWSWTGVPIATSEDRETLENLRALGYIPPDEGESAEQLPPNL